MYEYLQFPRELERTISRLAMVRDELEASLLPGGIRYDTDRVQTSPEDRLPDVIGRIVELEDQIESLQAEKARAIMRISEAIEQLEDGGQKSVLTAYYIRRMPMRKIAESLNYSEQWAYKTRRIGVRALAERV